MNKLIVAAAIAVVGLGLSMTEASAGDAKAGAKVFKKCKACHQIDNDKAKVGPSLKGIIGRAAATQPKFKRYSKAMKKSGVTWTEENIAKFLKKPKKFIKKSKMAFPGLKKQKDIDNVIAYIKSKS
ncbi:MAG: c-type cytochrome [Rhodospirillaceae bacterium]|jgi:cytochrome c|nr:c-type cytochrome [Rhodospirillaceae bacterium]MBT6136331.1 c-type cytochrome [Rhodospirillaceae bacterium]